MFDLTPYLPYLVVLGLVAAGPIVASNLASRQGRGTFGRPYDLILRDYFREAERRGRLLSLAVENRSVRIEKQERRFKRSR